MKRLCCSLPVTKMRSKDQSRDSVSGASLTPTHSCSQLENSAPSVGLTPLRLVLLEKLRQFFQQPAFAGGPGRHAAPMRENLRPRGRGYPRPHVVGAAPSRPISRPRYLKSAARVRWLVAAARVFFDVLAWLLARGHGFCDDFAHGGVIRLVKAPRRSVVPW